MKIGVLGIDPGVNGAFAFLDGESVIVEPMPLLDSGQIDIKELNRLIRHYADDITFCYFEKAGIRPGQSAQTTAASWRNFGIIEGMLACLNIKYLVVRPDEWSKEFHHGVVEKDKARRYRMIKVARRRIASELYPGIDLRRTEAAKFPDEGIVDALLIATWGFNKHQEMRGLK